MNLSRICVFVLSIAMLIAATALSSCSSGTATSSTTANTSYVAAYKALTWGSGVTVTFPSECTMSISTTGVPPYHNPYYLAPTSTQYPTTVVYSPGSGTAYSVVPYTPSAITPSSGTFNICPTKASATTRTAGGTIGVVLNGEVLFNGGVITTSQLDACNGITSATPEFPNGAYHYVLPIGVTSYASSMQCLTGTVSNTTLAEAQRIQCNMKAFKSGKGLQRTQPAKHQESMAGMAM